MILYSIHTYTHADINNNMIVTCMAYSHQLIASFEHPTPLCYLAMHATKNSGCSKYNNHLDIIISLSGLCCGF